MKKNLIDKNGEVRELKEEDFRRMRPASEVLPGLVASARNGRGPQKEPTKEAVTIRYSPEILEFFRATGKGWQTRLNNALLDLVRKKAKA